MRRSHSGDVAFTIHVDTREQPGHAYDFSAIARSAFPFSVASATLRTGDYQLACHGWDSDDESQRIAIERKTLSDLYGSLSSGRMRFEKEFVRLAEFGYAALVIESPWDHIAKPNDWLRHPTQMLPRSAIATLLLFDDGGAR